jgi:peptidoglycan/LPS O-acetylase OafA/YrhL
MTQEKPAAGRVEWLDGVRGAAALFVVFHHMWLSTWTSFPRTSGPWWLTWLLYGHMAVAVFIVVSGFSLALVPMRNGGQLAGGVKRFLRRRAWRILPAYWAALIVSVALTAVFLDPGYGPAAIARTLAVHGSLLQDVVGSETPNGAFWSIAIEWQIYFLFPLILLIGRRTSVGTASLITLAAVLLAHEAAGLGGPLRKIDGLTPQFLALFAMGAAAVWLRGRLRPETLRRALAPVALVSLGSAVALALTEGSEWVVAQFFWMDLLFGIGVASVLALIYAGGLPAARRVLASRPALRIGLFSYSIYLIHAPIVSVLDKYGFAKLGLDPLAKFGAMVVVGGPLILGLSYGFHLLFEAPFLRHRSLSALRELPVLQPFARRRPMPRPVPVRSFGLLDDHHELGIVPAPHAAGERAAG